MGSLLRIAGLSREHVVRINHGRMHPVTRLDNTASHRNDVELIRLHDRLASSASGSQTET
jgi:hypothetical protein